MEDLDKKRIELLKKTGHDNLVIDLDKGTTHKEKFNIYTDKKKLDMKTEKDNVDKLYRDLSQEESEEFDIMKRDPQFLEKNGNLWRMFKPIDKFEFTLEARAKFSIKESSQIVASVLSAGLTQSHIFKVNDTIKKVLLLTDLPEEKDKIMTPFPYIYMDLKIGKADGFVRDYRGILLCPSSDGDDIVSVVRWVQDESIFPETDGLSMFYLSSENKNSILWEDVKAEGNDELEKARLLKQKMGMAEDLEKLRKFVINFLLFLTQPEIEVITVQRRFDPEAPPENRKVTNRFYSDIKITGKLKIYLDTVSSGKHVHFSHRFWVRGHWRTLRSEKWKYKRGQKIWIPPFIRGQGLLLVKDYEVKKDG